MELDILFEDNHLIIINKPPSTIVQGDKTGDTPLTDHIKLYLKQKYNKPGEVFVGLPHRIDRPVSGVVLLAKTSKALERLNKMFHDNNVTKIYWAIVYKKPPKDEDMLTNYIIKNEAQNKSYVYDKEVINSKIAKLRYKLLLSSDNYHLLEVELFTGRHHQIRAQLAKIGCCIKGDLKYGATRSNKDASIHLHARSLEFKHPVTNINLITTASPPQDSLWNYFVKNMNA